MAVYVLPLMPSSEPVWVPVREDVPLDALVSLVEVGAQLVTTLDFGTVSAGIAYTDAHGWQACLELHTITRNERLMLPLSVAEALAPALLEKAAGACDCRACNKFGIIARGFPEVVAMVRAKIESGAPAPATDELAAAQDIGIGPSALACMEPAGRA